ncbi:hypothetical protein K466DRAFT_604747 [Polyporus arcularius HHB13444]|uniref:Uncharacterized protein n=1 Tax=Polyporus arcularius HHB13444 TaxID=1314778 RepID=A0A5C3NXN8_9APHY|nr:hypothetical protein K466DRAFT_604747 [Polyporus arcularius HHB13444]
MSSAGRIEDSDPLVQYSSSQWIVDPFTLASGSSRHGAALPELTVSLRFRGTGVQVVGILDASVHDGQPTTMYTLDGVVVDTYNAPWTSERTFDVVFYVNRSLSPADHTIEITNVNGTSPNLFWLDYFLVDAAPTSGATTSTTSRPPTFSASSSTSSSSSSSFIRVTTTRLVSETRTSVTPTSAISTTSITASLNLTASRPTSFTGDNITSTTFQTGSTVSLLSSPASSRSSSASAMATAQGPTSSSASRVATIGVSAGGAVGVVLLAVALALWWRLGRRKAALCAPSIFTQETASFTGTAFSRPDPDGHFCKMHGCVHRQHAPCHYATSADSIYTSSSYAQAHDVRRSYMPSIEDPLDAAAAHGRHSSRPSSPSSESEVECEPIPPVAETPEPATPSPSTILRAEVARSPWYVPPGPERQPDVQSLLRAIHARERPRRPLRAQAVPPSGRIEEMDSGLRLYRDDGTLPPRYTAR